MTSDRWQIEHPRLNAKLLFGYAFVAAIALISERVALPYTQDLRGDAPPFVVFAVAILFLFAVRRPLVLVFRRHPSPLRQLQADFTGNIGWIVSIVLLCWALPTTLDAATTIKKAIPSIQPYFADPLLIQIDRFIFFGRDAWQISHAVFGQPATRIIDAFYTFWLIAQLLLGLAIIFTKDRHFQLRAALTFQISWIALGAALASAWASVGPCFVHEFYGTDEFQPLMVRLRSIEELGALRGMDYLLSSVGTNNIGSGISAMPSLHVGISVLIALCFAEKLPRWQWVAWLYVAIMYVGSIHLGWHYATDGIVSGVAIAVIWYLTGLLLRPADLLVAGPDPAATDHQDRD